MFALVIIVLLLPTFANDPVLAEDCDVINDDALLLFPSDKIINVLLPPAPRAEFSSTAFLAEVTSSPLAPEAPFPPPFLAIIDAPDDCCCCSCCCDEEDDDDAIALLFEDLIVEEADVFVAGTDADADDDADAPLVLGAA